MCGKLKSENGWKGCLKREKECLIGYEVVETSPRELQSGFLVAYEVRTELKSGQEIKCHHR